MLNKLDLVLVIQDYNEEGCIENVIKFWTNGISNILENKNFKTLVINDVSKDNTGAILDQIAARNKLLIAKHQLSDGHGNAVVNGYKLSVEMNPDFIFQTDSDDQFIPEDFKYFWDLKDQSDFILGYRQIRHDDPFRLFITKILKFSLLVSWQSLKELMLFRINLNQYILTILK